MNDRLEEILREGMERDSAPIEVGEEFWGDTLSRGTRLRRRRRAGTVLGVAVFAGAAVIAAGSLDGESGVPRPAEPTVVDTPSPIPDAKLRHVLLDAIELDDGRRIELIAAWRESWEVGPCLQVHGIDERRRACGRAPSEREPPADIVIMDEALAQRDRTSPFEVYGATSADVARVEVEYTVEGEQRRQPAHLLRVTDPNALDRGGIAEPFGFFFAELPADTTASEITAVAFARDGRPLGSIEYPAYPLRAFISGPSRR